MYEDKIVTLYFLNKLLHCMDSFPC